MKLRHVLLLASVFTSSELFAQNLSDAARLMRDPLPVGARSTGMNRSLIAGIRDYTALDLNPAAIAPIGFREFGLTISHRQQSSVASYLGTTAEADMGSTDLGSIGFGFRIPTDTGHFAWGISYDRVADYSNRYSFKAVNNSSSFINTRGFIDDPGIANGESIDEYRDFLKENNLAWWTYLTEDIDSGNTQLTTRLKSGLQESGTVTEEGGMNALRFGAGIDVGPGISIGGAMNVLFGSYESRRVLEVSDVNGLFSNEAGDAPNRFQSAEIIDLRTQSQAGLNLKFGLLVYTLDLVRFGLTVETPTWLSIEDNFVRTASSRFASGERYESETDHEPLIVNDYDITTPFKFGGGLSFHLPNTTISGSATYFDASQVEFGNSEHLGKVNDFAKTDFAPVLSWSVGAEHVIPVIGVAVRAGYGIEASPYEFDVESDYDVKSLSAGISVLLSKNTALDFSYRRTNFTTDHTVYSDETPEGTPVRAIVDRDDVTRNAFSATFGYRF
ncbi:MAG TPA: hypothetical protein VFH43_06940 [Candidatus Kapabacteria bacterium]|jgi:hypothetical protein|nr:hypothetical protein [Candidatus Kapabacteria bacterium]